MKRQATKLLALTMSTILAATLTACGDGSGADTGDVIVPVEAEPILSDLELEILNLETKYNKGEFTQADYLALADAYSRAGYIRRQRDMLEQDYRLYQDTDAFAALQELVVNLEEETENIKSRAQEMQNDLELPEYLDESVNLIDSEDWFLTMMPKLKEGKRGYYLEQEGQPLLYIEVGYADNGECFSKVWYTAEQTKRYLSQEGTALRMVTVTSQEADYAAEKAPTDTGTGTTVGTTDIADSATPKADSPDSMTSWNGSFEAWSVDCATSRITHEQGTMQNGVLTGDYTCNIHTGDGPLEAFSLWNSRGEQEYVTYTGTFDADGKVLTEQPTEEVKKKLLEGTGYTDLILYAYDADGENCLWQGIGEGKAAADYYFGQEMIGLEVRPEYTSYEVTESMKTDGTGTDDNGTGNAGADTDSTNTANNTAGNIGSTDNAADTTTPQIRIFDGEVQWFDGKYWVSAGSVKEMERQDPFMAYEENRGAASDGDTASGTGSITGTIVSSIMGGANGSGTGSTTDATNITGSDIGSTAGNKNSGSISKPMPTPAAKPAAKPSATKPAAATPTVTPAPTPVPAPVQAPPQNNNNDDDDDDSGSDDSGSSDSGSSDSGSSDSGSSDSGSSGGNDVDMDWTPDLL